MIIFGNGASSILGTIKNRAAKIIAMAVRVVMLVSDIRAKHNIALISFKGDQIF